MSTLAISPTTRLSYRGKRNLVPLPYRNVSMQPYDDAFTEQALIAHLLGREAYRRTEFIVFHGQADAMAVVAIAKRDSKAFFSRSWTSRFWHCQTNVLLLDPRKPIVAIARPWPRWRISTASGPIARSWCGAATIMSISFTARTR